MFEYFSGTGEALFDHIASCLADFVFDRELQNEVLPLGFTFSFPCQQNGLDKATLVRWTKGFNCSGVEGEDVVTIEDAGHWVHFDKPLETIAVIDKFLKRIDGKEV